MDMMNIKDSHPASTTGTVLLLAQPPFSRGSTAILSITGNPDGVHCTAEVTIRAGTSIVGADAIWPIAGTVTWDSTDHTVHPVAHSLTAVTATDDAVIYTAIAALALATRQCAELDGHSWPLDASASADDTLMYDIAATTLIHNTSRAAGI